MVSKEMDKELRKELDNAMMVINRIYHLPEEDFRIKIVKDLRIIMQRLGKVAHKLNKEGAV